MAEHGTWERAVIDRIEDGRHAVLLIADRDELVIPVEHLPEGASAGVWLQVVREGDQLTQIVIDTEETERRRDSVRAKMAKLRERGRHRNADSRSDCAD